MSKPIDALRVGPHKSFASVTDDCTKCGWATWQVEPKPGHWLCVNPKVRYVFEREQVAVGVAFDGLCRGKFHTKARAA